MSVIDVLFLYNESDSGDARGISSRMTSDYLNSEGVISRAAGWSVTTEVFSAIVQCQPRVVVMAAPVEQEVLMSLAKTYPGTMFYVNNHCAMGQLQYNFEWIRDTFSYFDVAENVRVGLISPEDVRTFGGLTGRSFYHLPYLCPVPEEIPVQKPIGEVLRVGAFGSMSIRKNQFHGLLAAGFIAKKRHVKLEYHVLDNRFEVGGHEVLSAVGEMAAQMKIQFVKHCKKPHGEFLDLVGQMDLLMNCTFSESFHLMVLDGIYRGVPSVCCYSPIAPQTWIANPTDYEDMADTGFQLLPYANWEAVRGNLSRYNLSALKLWKGIL